MKGYFVEHDGGRREVTAENKLDAVVKATGRPASRFTEEKDRPGHFRETACNPGHQGVYRVTPRTHS